MANDIHHGTGRVAFVEHHDDEVHFTVRRPCPILVTYVGDYAYITMTDDVLDALIEAEIAHRLEMIAGL